jgi:hypothetical protein
LNSLWQTEMYTVTQLWGGQFNAALDDTPDNVTGVSAMPCNWLQSQWTGITNSMITALPYPVIFNGLNMPSQKGVVTLPATLLLLNSAIGGESEGCYDGFDPNFPKLNGLAWQAEEDTQIAVQQQNKLFLCHGFTSTDGSTSWAIDIRLYQYASYVLTYDPNVSLYSSKWLTTSGFSVQPETQLVPTKPLISTPSAISSLLLPSGVYGREYSECFFASHYVGPCAAVVNSNKTGSYAFPWPTKYHHTLVLNGSGIADGGTASTNGGAPPSEVAPQTGLVVFP